MSKSIPLGLLLALACTACTRAPEPGITAGTLPKAAPQGHSLPGYLRTSRPAPRSGFARLPDRGDLVGYPARRVVRQDGAYTWHRAELSEAHALQALTSGRMRVTLPDGAAVDFRYQRHVEHPGGDWTWVGQAVGGRAPDEILLTFGDKAAFGTIARPGRTPLQLTMRDGASWLVATDPAKVAGIDNGATRPTAPDYLIPPAMAAAGASTVQSGAPGTAANTTNAATTVDVVLGYTPGFANAYGGASQALTRLNFLVDVTNQAHTNSQVDARVRLVHALQVDYPDATDNGDALEALTGFKSGSGSIPVPAALQPLRAARDQYGGDLVSLVRKFNTPENDGCGIAWLIGGGRTTVDGNDAPFGYSVVSDGQDVGSDGKTYFCRQETLAHELGHNMGLQHDRGEADGDDNVLQNNEYGAFAYSFGHKTGSGAGNFYTVMAYGDTGQTPYRVFSNPRITSCGGVPCGVADTADNARALGVTLPVIGSFRATVVPPAVPRPDLYAIAKRGASGRTELHRLSGASEYTTFNRNVATALQQAGADRVWKFLVGDYNRDGVKDLYLVLRQGASASTEVHILDGATNYQSFLLHRATALHPTGGDDTWDFVLGDHNRDGMLDLYAIAKTGFSGSTEIHVLNGANGFTGFLLNIGSALHPTDLTGAWDYTIGDVNRDGFADVIAINKTGLDTTKLHALSGAANYTAFARHAGTALTAVGTSNAWDFKAGDADGDGIVDLYVLLRTGASGTTEVHVLDGETNFQTWLLHRGSGLHQTGDDFTWDFDLG